MAKPYPGSSATTWWPWSARARTGLAPHDDPLAVTDKHGVVRHEFTATAPNQVWLWDLQCRRRH